MMYLILQLLTEKSTLYLYQLLKSQTYLGKQLQILTEEMELLTSYLLLITVMEKMTSILLKVLN